MKKIYIFLAIIIFTGSAYFGFNKYQDYKEEQRILQEKLEQERIAKEKKEKYEKCLITKPAEEIDLSEKESELNSLLKKYSVSLFYEDLTFNNTFTYNKDKVYYGASLIKLVDALYLYDNEVDINSTMVYKKSYKRAYSSCMDKHKYNEKVTLKELVNCALSVSDNTAHMMLIDYIGYNNLKSYGKSLGAKNILSGWDNYGNQSASDTNIYLKRAYQIMNESEYGAFLKEVMFNTHCGYLNTSEVINVAHKYGYYNSVFHDIGVVFDEHPYTISILSSEGNKSYSKIINSISKKIKEYHDAYWKKLDENCYISAYGKKEELTN